MYLKDLQNILQNLKPEERITLEKIGNSLGITKSTVSQRIKSKSKLRLDEITKIEKYFNISLTDRPEWLYDDRNKFQKFIDYALNSKISENTDDDIIEIERIYDVKPSCGMGTDLIAEPIVEPFRISKKTISTYLRCSSPENLKMFQATGDSMEDKIYDGDWLLVDVGRKDVSDSGVFIFTANSLYRCKRLNMTLDGRLEVKSDNPKYDTEIIGQDSNIEIEIIGRVLNNLSRSI